VTQSEPQITPLWFKRLQKRNPKTQGHTSKEIQEAKYDNAEKVKNTIKLMDNTMRQIYAIGLSKQTKVKELINTVFQGRDLTVADNRTLFGNKADQEGLWCL